MATATDANAEIRNLDVRLFKKSTVGTLVYRFVNNYINPSGQP